jgi:hypothetical protein
MFKKYCWLCFLFFSNFLLAQDDSLNLQGTIRISKAKSEKVYIRSFAKFRYEISDAQSSSASNGNVFQPFPVVEGHAFPFNYSKFFNNKFRSEKINMNGKSLDTVKIEMRISNKGKVNFNNKTIEKNNSLSLLCLDFLKQIQEWQPAYIIVSEKGIFKKQTVIKPNKVNVASVGVVTIIFSTDPFED